MASGASFPIRILDGPLLDEALAAGQGPDATLSCGPGLFVFDLGGRVGRREVLTASLHGVKKAGNKLKLLLSPSPGGPGHVIGLRREAELVGATDPAFGTFRKAVVKTSKGPGGKASPGGASTPSASVSGASPMASATGAAAATPVGEDVMATFRATSAASAKGRRLAAAGAADGPSGQVAKKECSAGAATAAEVASAAGSALAEHLGAATDLADAERGEAAIADGKLPEASVREQALRDDPALRSEHRSLVVKGAIVSEEEFWMGSEGRLQALRDAAARLRARAYSRRRSAARTQRSIGMRVEVSVTPEMTQQLLATDSRLRAAYAEHVASGKVSVMDFWRRYFTHMARQRDRQALRLREDAIAGRPSSSVAAAALPSGAAAATARSAAAGGNATPLAASARGDDALFAGVGAVSAEDLAVARTAAARRAALVDPRFSLAATAQDAQTGVLAAGPGDLIGADESAAAAASAAVSRAGRGTRAAQRLYEPDDVRVAHSSEAERVPFEAVQRSSATGLPLAMQPAWADWARASARRGTEVLALLWRLMAKAAAAGGGVHPSDAAKVSDALRRVSERVTSLQSGMERLRGTPDEAVAGPVIEVLRGPLLEAAAAAERLLGVARA
ncbi:hypothetical protein FNF31_07236 [Cafeteria roenbergensis]|uniref:BSD domain-containing protein n=1 Tax=Cafeteria roenbergensis TaxID=33653 RepID=A0A5A8C849_CAFRO|nr:hypothetical protein FNF31_07236 [Cafeteria roenbergensis]